MNLRSGRGQPITILTAELGKTYAAACSVVQVSTASTLCMNRALSMANCFMAGLDLVRWDLTALGHDGPYRLSIHHGNGSIVEYFDEVSDALVREGQLEALLIAARTAAHHAGGY